MTETKAPPRLYKLGDVAEKTGIPLKTLQAGCRAEPPTISHVDLGSGRRYLTDELIAELIAKHTVSAQQTAAADPDDDGRAADRARVARLAGATT